MKWRVVCAIAIAWLSAARASACSVTEDYFKPSNYELVQMADAIVVATATTADKSDEPAFDALEFHVDKVVKGPAPTSFKAGNAGTAEFPATVSDPDNIITANTDAFSGGCNRMIFSLGKQYVVFLGKGSDGTYRQLGAAFSRVNEDYFGDDSTWMRAIRSYLEIQAKYGPMQQLDVLEALARAKLKALHTRTTEIEVLDIVDHLRSRTPWKPTAYLLQSFDALERGEAPKYGVSYWRDDEGMVLGADVIADSFSGKPKPPAQHRVETEKQAVVRALVVGDHADAAPLFDRFVAMPKVSAPYLSFAIRFFAKNKQYRRAYALIETRAVNMLAAVSLQDARFLMSGIMEAQRGDDYEDGHERWRSDPYVRAAWPELALHLYWLQYRVLWSGYLLADRSAIETLATGDYRARPLVTLALAGEFNEPVRAWAIAELNDDAKRQAWEAKADRTFNEDDPAILPMQALVRSFGGERDAMIKKVACQSERRRRLLLSAIGEWGGQVDYHWPAEIALMKGSDEDNRKLAAQALARLYARQVAAANTLFAGGPEYELLEGVIRGQKLKIFDKKVEPLHCPK